ncbi:hypothetical protein FQN52_003839 [Onygenales sp. PD_12]|nr:hypothetical protein FQN52_003839 [Onygenales sp. PD_12]
MAKGVREQARKPPRANVYNRAWLLKLFSSSAPRYGSQYPASGTWADLQGQVESILGRPTEAGPDKNTVRSDSGGQSEREAGKDRYDDADSGEDGEEETEMGMARGEERRGGEEEMRLAAD